MGKLVTKVFTASGTWAAPAGVSHVMVQGVGGGGSGGSGGSDVGSGGGGGGGAKLHRANLTVTPGATYTVTIGAGGASVAAPSSGSANGVDGNDGGDTLLISPGPVTVFTARGAKGGSKGWLGADAAGGGPPVRGNYRVSKPTLLTPREAGSGGVGDLEAQTFGSAGQGTGAGAGGAGGTGTDGVAGAIAPGGGGGASEWTGNVPGHGGGTSDGNGAATAGTLGAGGGGGLGGNFLVTEIPGGDSGAGGNGALSISWIE